MYALRASDRAAVKGRRRPTNSVSVNGLYARWENNRLKVGLATDSLRAGVFWQAPGDQVVEAYIQARLHLMGISPATKHGTRMSEWFRTDLTPVELVPLLNQLQDEARRLDQRWKSRR